MFFPYVGNCYDDWIYSITDMNLKLDGTAFMVGRKKNNVIVKIVSQVYSLELYVRV